MIRHAGLVATRLRGGWRGVLIEGPSGSGKSDLALRALGAGFRLVADDRVIVFASGGRLFGRAPPMLSGLIEARGFGIFPVAPILFAEIILRVRCVASPGGVERLPDVATTAILDIPVPTLDLWPFDAAAPQKLIMALEHLGLATVQVYQAAFAPLDRRVGA